MPGPSPGSIPQRPEPSRWRQLASADCSVGAVLHPTRNVPSALTLTLQCVLPCGTSVPSIAARRVHVRGGVRSRDVPAARRPVFRSARRGLLRRPAPERRATNLRFMGVMTAWVLRIAFGCVTFVTEVVASLGSRRELPLGKAVTSKLHTSGIVESAFTCSRHAEGLAGVTVRGRPLDSPRGPGCVIIPPSNPTGTWQSENTRAERFSHEANRDLQ